MRWVIYAVIVVILLGCTTQKTPEADVDNKTAVGAAQDASPETQEALFEQTISDVWISTEDGLSLSSTYYSSESDEGVILLHMLDHDRHTWDSFAEKLQDEGYHVISLDLRGHGESDLDWRDFSDEDFKDMVFDAKAAADYLKSKGAESYHIAGASIGANIALNYAATDKAVEKVILLSPGIKYRGVSAETVIENKVFIAASEDDTYSAESSRQMAENLDATLELFPGNAHGTDILSSVSGFDAALIVWL